MVGVSDSTFYVTKKGSHFKHISRNLSSPHRARGSLLAAHKYAARKGMLATLNSHKPEDGQAKKKRTPQKAYLRALQERLYHDTMHLTIRKRLLAWYPQLDPHHRPAQRQPNPEREHAEDIKNRLLRRSVAWASH